jgi:hypothetical protein
MTHTKKELFDIDFGRKFRETSQKCDGSIDRILNDDLLNEEE